MHRYVVRLWHGIQQIFCPRPMHTKWKTFVTRVVAPWYLKAKNHNLGQVFTDYYTNNLIEGIKICQNTQLRIAQNIVFKGFWLWKNKFFNSLKISVTIFELCSTPKYYRQMAWMTFIIFEYNILIFKYCCIF